MNDYPGQTSIIRQEAAKKTRHRPIRRLLSEAPDVLTALFPCFMASPLSVSQLLSADRRYFDYVIFDEASQVLPEDAVTSLMRATYAIVAGDRNQLPPNQFFADADEDSGSTDDPVEEVQGFESVLDQMCGFLEPWGLDWHYRSRDESLIAFSNRHIYRDSLVTFPSIGTDRPAVSHIVVTADPGRAFQESASAEVECVVDLVLQHAKISPNQTLGVIALGVTHSRRVEAAIDKRRVDHPELDSFFAEDRLERFFVKNLERVQGDERDVIIFTLGAGRDQAGKVSNVQFGPLNRETGRRRLNVAITRARRQMLLVSSFTRHNMTPGREGTGTELLRQYIEYAGGGGRSSDAGTVTSEPLNPFELDVRDTLVAAGIPLIEQLGTSRYRLDFAAQHPHKPGRFVLAIECDGATYHSAPTARDRDRLRQQHLEALGWRFHRIWSTDWFTRRDREIVRAVSAYNAAVEAADRADSEKTDARDEPASRARESVSTTPARRSNRPAPPGRQITEYGPSQLDAMVRWVASDGLLRTDDEIVSEVVRELGFKRRGSRIDATIRRAIDRTKF